MDNLIVDTENTYNLSKETNLLPVVETKGRFSYRVNNEHIETSINSLSANDKLTLELLTNRTQYRKCLSLVNPDKYNEIQIKLQKYSQYFTDINTLTNELLENPEKMVSTEINDAFDNYINSCIRYFDLQEIVNNSSNKINDDDDMLFGNCIKTESLNSANTMKSYWGKSIKKTGPN
jgi:hypothetical protein